MDNYVDELTPFRRFIARAKVSKKKAVLVSPEYLKRLWEQQKGICPYLKIPLILTTTSRQRHGGLRYASMDRVDSSRGYIEGNVEFVSNFINYAKNRHSKQEVLDILQEFKTEPIGVK